MARRRSDDTFTVLWDLFMATPWWVCPVTAAVVYLGLTYAIPALFTASPLLSGIGDVSRLFAPWAAAVVLFIGVAAAIRRWGGGILLDRQKSTETISALTWREFEELLAAAYRRQGYQVVETGGGGPDGGVDLVLHGKDETALVQCKQWRAGKVGVRPVRELHGVLSSRSASADRAIFVTFGEYTQDARRFADENSIELVGRDRLLEMVMAARRTSASAAASAAAETDGPALDSDGVPRGQAEAAPSCPRCGRPMVLRRARRGDRAGSQFWGCTGYPSCRGTLDLRSR